MKLTEVGIGVGQKCEVLHHYGMYFPGKTRGSAS